MNSIITRIRENRLLKTGVSYSLAVTLYSVVGMIVGFVSLRWLAPDVYGIWQSFTIIISYLPIFQLGIQSGLNLELPVMLGKGETKNANSIVSTGLFFAMALSLLLMVLFIICLLIILNKQKPIEYVLGFTAVSIMAIVQCYRLHYIATYRSASAFNKLSLIYIISSFVNIFLIFFIYWIRYYGLLLYYVGSEIVATFLMWRSAPYRSLRPSFSFNCFKQLFKRGIFMTFVNQIIGVIESLPKLMLLKYGGVFQVGLFAPALAIGTIINLIPSQIVQFLQPQFGYRYGQTGMAIDMWKYLKKITFIMPICILPVSLLLWVLMPFLLEFLFPKYLESLLAIRILLIGFSFSSGFITRSFLITIKAYKEVIVLYLIDLALFISLPFALISLTNYPIIVNMSLGMTISYVISYILTYMIAGITIKQPIYNRPNPTSINK